MLILQISAIIVAFSSLINAKVFTKCELAMELNENYNIAWEDVGTYVCIAERQSNLNTKAIGQGLYYGIYQMSSEFWCDTNSDNAGKACNLHCNDLLDDDLSDDLRCMKTIIDEHQRISGNGLSAWPSGVSCQSLGNKYIADCSIESNHVITKSYDKADVQQKKTSGNMHEGKIYERCELAQELRYQHNIPMKNIATWVCIAKHESNFNTSAIGRLNWDGSEDHGLFQISDLYWCGENGKSCDLKCEQLRDNDITDDVKCMLKIHEEHTRLSGDGFNAWAVYPRCKGQSNSYIDNCFDAENEIIPFKPIPGIQQTVVKEMPKQISYNGALGMGKVYNRCELALELKNKHNIPKDQIAMWVCIAKHESNFNTSAIGRLNWDGSEDHGLFQISDLYWCGENGKSCELKCEQLRDNDITDDVKCMLKIHEEHTRLSGDGFNAWAVYPRCKGQSEPFIKDCFEQDFLPIKPQPGVQQHFMQKPYVKVSNERKPFGKNSDEGKVYERCELAQELRYKHKISLEQVAIWVCIAKHESNFNTSTIGRLKKDGSKDHGLFQISELQSCGPLKGCGLSCEQLRDNDITDDVKCMLKIHEEHTRLSGDGFTVWTSYSLYCKDNPQSYINSCFTDEENFITKTRSATQSTKNVASTEKLTSTTDVDTTTSSALLNNLMKLSTVNNVNSVSTEKNLFNFHSQSVQQMNVNVSSNKEPNDEKLIQTTLPYPIKNLITRTTTKYYTKLNETGKERPPLPLTQLRTTTRRKVTATTTRNLQNFNVFSFYLNDFTSKPTLTDYKPIKFSDKATVIFKKPDNLLLQQKISSVTSPPMTTTTARHSKYLENTTTAKVSTLNASHSNIVQKNKNNNSKIFTYTRSGAVGNITPHSIDYLLKLTTPKSFYG